MLRIKVKHLKRMGIALLLISVIALSIAGLVTAQSNGNLVLNIYLLHSQQPIFNDLNNNGINEENELIGYYDVHDGNEVITVSWDAYSFGNANGSYRIALRQYQLTGPTEYIDLKPSHHWASGEDTENFTMGSFGFGEEICLNCPTAIVITPETYELVYNADTGASEYLYTPLPGAPTYQSSQFVIEIFRPYVCDVYDIGPCLHPLRMDFWQEYYVPDLEMCSCNCTLTADTCKDLGIGNSPDPFQCICIFK